MTSREQYFDLLKKHRLLDTLSLLDQLSYSEKLRIIENILFDDKGQKQFSSTEINLALQNYELNYIRVHRVNIRALKNTLYGLCKMFREKGI